MKKLRRYAAAAVAAVMAAAMLPSCAPKPEKVFEDEANAYFETYRESKQALSGSAVYEYNETGSVAYIEPKSEAGGGYVKLGEYYTQLKDEFRAAAKTDADKLFIDFCSYKASDEITGVEIVSKSVLEGVETQGKKAFTLDKEGVMQPDRTLKRLIKMKARVSLADSDEYKDRVDTDKLKTYDGFSLLFKGEGVDVIYEAGSVAPESAGSIVATVPYTDLRSALPESIKQNVPKPEREVDVTKKLVALTFDDGPSGTHTNEILDVLEKYDSVATFFDVGELMETYPEAMKRADAMGCEMGSHSYSHANLQTSSAEKIRSEIQKADDAFKAVLGYTPKLLRPPYGAVGSTLYENCDKYLIGWSVDTLDWKSRNAQSVIQSVKSIGNLEGDVILMHAIYGSTADAVEELVPWLIEEGYQLVTISELMEYGYDIAMEPGKYYNGNTFSRRKMVQW